MVCCCSLAGTTACLTCNASAQAREMGLIVGSPVVIAPIVVRQYDYVEVVRCKDCKHSYQGNYFRGYACALVDGTFTVSGDDFCSRGERREDD